MNFSRTPLNSRLFITVAIVTFNISLILPAIAQQPSPVRNPKRTVTQMITPSPAGRIELKLWLMPATFSTADKMRFLLADSSMTDEPNAALVMSRTMLHSNDGDVCWFTLESDTRYIPNPDTPATTARIRWSAHIARNEAATEFYLITCRSETEQFELKVYKFDPWQRLDTWPLPAVLPQRVSSWPATARPIEEARCLILDSAFSGIRNVFALRQGQQLVLDVTREANGGEPFQLRYDLDQKTWHKRTSPGTWVEIQSQPRTTTAAGSGA